LKPITHIPVQFSVWIDEDSFDVHVRFTGFDNEEEAGLFATEMCEQPLNTMHNQITVH